MKIKMKSTAAGPFGVFNFGQVYDVEQSIARRFIDGGHAELVEPAATAPEPLPESAAIAPPEDAMVAAPAPRRHQPSLLRRSRHAPRTNE